MRRGESRVKGRTASICCAATAMTALSRNLLTRSTSLPVATSAALEQQAHSQDAEHGAHEGALCQRPRQPARERSGDAARGTHDDGVDGKTDGDLQRAERE